MDTIRNPIEWGADELERAAAHVESVGRSLRGSEAAAASRVPRVRPIAVADLKDVLAKGLADFAAYRTDVVFLCLVYPFIGLVVAWFAFDYDMLPLLLPLVAGIAFLGPVAAVGLYEMSRRREAGMQANWAEAFSVISSPRFGAIVVLGLGLLVIFLLWLAAAQVIYMITLGPAPPPSVGAFIEDVFTTGAGWLMILLGLVVGALFAVVVLAISVVSFPLLLDRDVGLAMAIMTSLRVVSKSPRALLAWGLIVACGLVIGSLPLFFGLIIVMPVLGHATWHLYRKTVE